MCLSTPIFQTLSRFLLARVRPGENLSNGDTISWVTHLWLSINWWYAAVIIEGIIIAVIISILIRAHHSYQKDKERYRRIKSIDAFNHEESSFITNLTQARKLHKELCRKYHPNSFDNQQQKLIAENLLREIGVHRDNYQKLLQIQMKAEQSLITKTKSS